MKTLPLELIRPMGQPRREERFNDDASWQAERVSFPHCHKCVTDRVRALDQFQAGWDGASAKSVDPAIIAAACKFFDRLADEYGELLIRPFTEAECLVPHCVPLVSGGLQLEWHIEDRILELEFENPDAIRYLKWWPDQEVGDSEATYSASDLDQSADLIRWVFSGDATSTA